MLPKQADEIGSGTRTTQSFRWQKSLTIVTKNSVLDDVGVLDQPPATT